MIVDNIKNMSKYTDLRSDIKKAIEYLSGTDFTKVESGRYELDGSKMYSIVQRYKTRLDADAIWESHRKYIDVQFIAAGNERCGIAELASAPAVKTPYTDEKDVIFYEPGSKYFDAPMGSIYILYPEDIHGPCLARGNPPVPEDVVKVVVKVAV